MFNFFLTLSFLISLNILNVQSEVEYENLINLDVSSNRTDTNLKASDYIFDTPDVIKEYVRDDGTKVRLDAYQTKNNAGLMQSGQFSGLRWFSLGQPEIVKVNQQSMFGFNKLSFWLEFEMLTNRDKEVLSDEVKRAKGFNVSIAYFLLYCERNNRLLYIIRAVYPQEETISGSVLSSVAALKKPLCNLIRSH